MKKRTARNWYRWLWLSPLITIPSLILSMLFGGFIYNPGRELICGGSWRHCDHEMMADLLNILFIAFASTFWYLILLKPALDKKSAFVRWHGRQALLLGGLQATALLVSVPILDYESVRPGLILVLIAIWFFSTRWGQSQAARGDCSLLRWFGQTQKLHTRELDVKSTQTVKPKPPVQTAVSKTALQSYQDARNTTKEIVMNCPNCGTPEQARVKVCRSCGEAYASQDLMELRQLEFLLAETGAWRVAESLRAPYGERLESLRARLERRAPAQPKLAPEPVKAKSKPPVAPRPAPAPPRKVPFDQWLLSERNIKIALYSGGLLLVLAGLIFIGVNWMRIPGPGKFAITLMVTGLMYLGGYLLFQRPAYRLGGIALLGVASGFLTLNFAVLQIYVLGPSGLHNDKMWLIASPLCLLFYLLTAYWTRSDLFTYISLAAVISTVTAALVVVDAPLLAFVLFYSLLMLAILALARACQSTPLADYARLPMLIVSHVGMPLLIAAALVGWTFATGSMHLKDSPWLALLSLGVGVLFYATTDVLFKSLPARWAAAILFPLAVGPTLAELNFSHTASGVTLMLLALAYLGIGALLEQWEGRRSGGWPLYAMAYAVAALVTLFAIPDAEDLAKILVGDVILLAVSAAIHRNYGWVYGAVWLFTLPAYLFISLAVPALYNRGLLMAVLGLNYAVVGYILGRRKLGLGGPFLTAAAFLSIVIVVLTWNNPVVTSLVLVAVAVLYLLAALWLGWPWLLLPALLAVNLDVLVVNDILFTSPAILVRALAISYTTLGVALAVGGLGLRAGSRTTTSTDDVPDLPAWAWPLYLVAAVDLAGAYLAGLVIGGWLAIGLSLVLAVLLLTLAWLERAAFVEQKTPPILTYLGIGVIFVGHFYVIETLGGGRTWEVWPGFTATLCALFVALAWLLRREPLAGVYATPLRLAGLWLMAIPLLGSVYVGMLYDWNPLLLAVTFAIASITYAGDAALRRILNLVYLSIGTFAVVIWAILMALDVSEPQAYVIPPGLALLAVGWNERLRGKSASYRMTTMLGLIILMGSAFIQSLSHGAFGYAILLGIESIIALGWGARTRSRGYVQLGAWSLIANAIVQFGPGFVEWPRWIQIGITGSILLGGGLAALFKREEILATRQRMLTEWRQWQA